MKTYTINASCRKLGALGIWSRYIFTVQADSLEAAQAAAYETHEHFGAARIIDNDAGRSYDFFTLKPLGGDA